MMGAKEQPYAFFIGIDVSKNELDFAVRKGRQLQFHQEIGNEKQQIVAFISELKKMPGLSIRKSVFCMEHTGIYCNHLIFCLRKIKGEYRFAWVRSISDNL